MSREQLAAAAREVSFRVHESETHRHFQQAELHPRRQVREAIAEAALQQRGYLVLFDFGGNFR